MIRCFFLFLFCLLSASLGAAPVRAVGTPSFLVLGYGSVEDQDPDQSLQGVTTGRLIEQMEWLRGHGYQAIRVDDLVAASAGQKPLPPRAFLLLFRGGHTSFLARAFPLLKAFGMPAVLGVGSQAAAAKGRSAFLDERQLRQLEGSGLVEIAAAYDARDEASAVESFLKNALSHTPRLDVLPAGDGDQIAFAVKASGGRRLEFSFVNSAGTFDALVKAPQALVKGNPDLGSYLDNVLTLAPQPPLRAVQIDLDYIYDPDPVQQTRNLEQVVARIRKLAINVVFLQAFANPEGDGLARALYFPNRHLPLRANLFAQAVTELRANAHVKVFGWLPLLSFDVAPDVERVRAWDQTSHQAQPDPRAYRRLSPFDPVARQVILEVYEDMARQAPIEGLLFHDDALLSDFEDAGPAALQVYRRVGFPDSIEAIRADAGLAQRWAWFKTESLIDLTQAIKRQAELWRAPLLTARNLYAPVMTTPESKAWFAQDYDRFLRAYDYTAVMAMPRLENIGDDAALDWMQQIVATASRRPDGLKRTLFMLQTVDWRLDARASQKERAIPAATLTEQMRFLARQGALNIGYYPDDFVTNTPDVDALHKEFSLQPYSYAP